MTCAGLFFGIRLLAVSLPFASASGATIVADAFDYPTGIVAGRNGGTGFSTAYSGSGQVNAGSLQYVDPAGLLLGTTGNRVSTTTSGGGMFRTISTANRPPGLIDGSGMFGANGTTVYLGFLVRLDSGNVTAFGDYGGISLFAGSSEQIFFGDPGFEGTRRFWGVDAQEGSLAVQESTVPVDGTVRLLIGRIDFGPGAETVRFYVDPPLSGEPAIPTLGPFAIHDMRFNRIRIQAGGAGRYSFDEVVVATTYTEVVPEPSAALLALTGALALAAGRRRAGS